MRLPAQRNRKRDGRIPRTTVNIPKSMYELIRKALEANSGGGYVSVDDFIRDVIRERLRKLGYDV